MHKRLIKRLISAALASALMIAGTAVAQPPGGAARVGVSVARSGGQGAISTIRDALPWTGHDSAIGPTT